MVSFEYEAVALAQIHNDVTMIVTDAWPASNEIPEGFGSNQIRQPVLEELGYCVA